MPFREDFKSPILQKPPLPKGGKTGECHSGGIHINKHRKTAPPDFEAVQKALRAYKSSLCVVVG